MLWILWKPFKIRSSRLCLVLRLVKNFRLRRANRSDFSGMHIFFNEQLFDFSSGIAFLLMNSLFAGPPDSGEKHPPADATNVFNFGWPNFVALLGPGMEVQTSPTKMITHQNDTRRRRRWIRPKFYTHQNDHPPKWYKGFGVVFKNN